ncbi:hypothetical protein D9M73_185550 [compost metagenome]
MTKYLDISGTQSSPQEEKKGDYMTNLLTRKGEKDRFSFDIPGIDMAIVEERHNGSPSGELYVVAILYITTYTERTYNERIRMDGRYRERTTTT